ncbi:hypothetical protein EIN_185090 [Entamoeba invadens IP1]|uniref:hypothetical protein n=1 Tax=Entamoeba invadens IP1 TaxID=370355 RepID=UPI0002C3F5C7|nr:hypothetical protein EIN_185090 [Entamoeba invadens IP1]ELP94132.1 hypothetical protein EIN_185090 [Entamoeba invadens IP1]|eukprot:XP_004260903.1 hypothetical protein EIN_185090 [Entamoeba invadens IP1]
MRQVLLLFVYLFTTSCGAGDFWVVWGERAFKRCMQIDKKKEECEVLQDTIEEQLMETAFPLFQKLDKKPDDVVARSLQVPYSLVGQRVVDKYLNLLVTDKIVSEDELSGKMFWEVTMFIMDCIHGEEPPVWKKVKEDAFWQRPEAAKYLKSIGVDLATVPTEEKKETVLKEDDKKKEEDNEWAEFDQFKTDL